MHHDRSIDHTIVVLRFADHLPQFLKTLNSGNLSLRHTKQCTESVALRQFSAPLWAAPLVNWTTRLLRLRSRLVRCFHLASFRVRFSIRARPSITHFIISFSESISTPRHCKGASTSRAVIWQILLFSIVGLVLRPSLVGHELGPCLVVAHVLFADDESRGDYFPVCLFSLACDWVVFPQIFCFSSTIFLWSSTPTIESSRFSLTASGCPIFPVIFCQV